MIKSFILIYCIFLSHQIICETDYCKICKNNSHTMCRFKDGPADNCKNYTTQKLDESIQKMIVGFHNSLRNKVASGEEIRGKPGPQLPASNMFILKWNEELAIIAQRWANQCISIYERNQHDMCKKTDRFEVGQNIIDLMRTNEQVVDFKEMIKQMLKEWYKEVFKLNNQDIKIFKSSTKPEEEIGHYTQRVWASTQYVGCAHASFTQNIQPTLKIGRIDRLVCNYGPTGNIMGHHFYAFGKPCSQCKNGCNQEYRSLCNHQRFIRKKRKAMQGDILKDVDMPFKINLPLYELSTREVDVTDPTLNKKQETDLKLLYKFSTKYNIEDYSEINKIHEIATASSNTMSKNISKTENIDTQKKEEVHKQLLDLTVALFKEIQQMQKNNNNKNDSLDIKRTSVDENVEFRRAPSNNQTTKVGKTTTKSSKRKQKIIKNNGIVFKTTIMKSTDSSTDLIDIRRPEEKIIKSCEGNGCQIPCARYSIENILPYRLRYQNGDKCFCLYRLRSSAIKVYVKIYILVIPIIMICIFLYMFNFVYLY